MAIKIYFNIMMFVHRVEYYSKTAAYSYVSELGAGSLGRIVLVRDQCTLRHYALKIVLDTSKLD